MKSQDNPLKRIRSIVYQSILHSLDAAYDLFRYMKYSNSYIRKTNDRQKLESLIFYYYHKIEKSLALPEVKPLFGLGYLETLLDLVDQWISLTGDREAVVYRGAYDALAAYREAVGAALSKERPGLFNRLDKLLHDHQGIAGGDHIGGTIPITRQAFESASQNIDFCRFVLQRHSVRSFTEQHIPDSAIYEAVKIAQRSPSVCNRQCARVHVFTSSADKANVFKYQNGNAGFGHLADRVLLITADLRAFLISGERNQGYCDAGMFAMTLVYALQAQGIASCCLNLDHSYSEDLALRKACKIPDAEVPVMMIAIGYPPENLKVTVSSRVPTEAVLSFRDLS